MSEADKIPLKFEIFQGDELVDTVELAQKVIKVGKLPSSHLRIDDENVSRMHAVVEVTGPDEIFIIDLGSSAGTIVNGEKVNKCKLNAGDELQLGDTRVVVTFDAAAVEAAPPAAEPAPVEASAPPVAAAAAAVAAPVAAAAVANPFAAPVAPPAAVGAVAAPAAHAHGGGSGGHGHGHGHEEYDPNIQYGIIASAPPVPSDMVETGDQALEVIVMWGESSVLHVEHMSPPRSFYVGDFAPQGGKARKGETGFLIGSESLGTDRLPVVLESGSPLVVIPPGATGEITLNDQSQTFEQLAAEGRLQPSSAMAGAQQYALPQGATARVEYKGFTFVTKPVMAGRKVAGSLSIDWVPLAFIFGSAAFFGIMLTVMYFMPPRPAALNFDPSAFDQSRLVEYMLEAEATQEEEIPEEVVSNENDSEGGTGKRHKDEEGAMGKESAKKSNNRYAIEGPEDNEDPHMAREHAREQAKTVGALGALASFMGGSIDAPTSPYGRDTALGNDPMSAMGALMGDQIGENFGFGGLGLRGTGRGGGGTGEGTIGLGNVGTIGHGAGGGTGSGYGRGAGGLSGRSARVPRIRTGSADVRGSLSKEVIRRVVRRHRNEVKFCYEQQLNQRPDLEGRVVVSFVISATGSVTTSSVRSSTLGNQTAERCIASAVRRWTFPSPDGGGIVVVNYPFMLSQSG